MKASSKFLIIWINSIFLFSSAYAGSRSLSYRAADIMAEDIGAFSIESSLSLPPITASELIGGNAEQGISLGRWTKETQPFIPFLPITQQITREIPSLWSMRISSKDSGNTMNIRYELTGDSGRPNCLSNISGSEMPVTIRPLTPVVIAKGKKSNLISGGINLYLKTGELHHAGRYAGTLAVIIDNF